MTSLGISPTAPSLLIPPNPSSFSVDNAPRGGILLNPRRESDASAPSSPAFIPLAIEPSSPGARRASEPPDSPRTPISPIEPTLSPVSAVPLASPTGTQRIRFAPLPDPRRPRSLSTGRNVQLKATEGVDGETTRTIEIRGVAPQMDYDDDDVAVVDDGDASDGEGYDGSRGRRWSKSMTMGVGSMNSVPGWRGTKKLLGLKEEKKEEVYTEGAPLKKSVSTGGFIGSSPFRWTAETERKRSMQGPAPQTLSSRLDTSHRRNSSLDPTSTAAPLGSSLGSSPQPVRMLNGRVYGSRRASEAAERQKQYRQNIEPAFVEWGSSEKGGLGSNASKSKGFLGDDDDGSGMEWVKRRREERLKKQQAEKEAAEASRPGGVAFNEPTFSGGSNSSQSSVSNSPNTSGSVITPSTQPAPLPPTPIIQVSEHPSPSANKALESSGLLGTSAPGKIQGREPEHITQAISMPKRAAEGRDVFDDAGDSDDGRGEDEEDESEEDDGDFDDDDEEDDEGPRTTSSAAGVEVVSRHKN